jgi:hypothetical protein
MMMKRRKKIFVVDVMTDNDVDDVLKMDDEDDDFDDVHVKDGQHLLNFVNLNTYVEMDEDSVVRVPI